MHYGRAQRGGGVPCVLLGAAQREQETVCAFVTKVLSGMSLPDSNLRL